MAELEQAIIEIWCGECEHKGKCEDAPYGGGLLGIDCKMKRDAFTALLTPCWQTARDEGYKVGFETGKAEGAILEKMHEAPLIEALREARAELQRWLASNECDCPPEGHLCGRPRLEWSITKIDLALEEVK